jgi:hypothetical protein
MLDFRTGSDPEVGGLLQEVSFSFKSGNQDSRSALFEFDPSETYPVQISPSTVADGQQPTGDREIIIVAIRGL